jgi:NAD(P)-dependent dehydrogenase (short-subunit alcohol dehydrogenase family)
MTTATPQQPLGSGFGARSTATEVLAGIDLSGRLAVLTGGYSGIGVETTRALTAAGAHVVVPARRPEAVPEDLAKSDRVEVHRLDLADLGSVRAFAEEFLASGRGIDVLINGAGVMACPETRVGPGWEAQFATNHLGHFALATGLHDALAAGAAERGEARIVSVSSTAHMRAGVDFTDLHFTRRPYDPQIAYAQSKTANVLFAVEATRRWAADGIFANAVNPGGVATGLQRHFTDAQKESLAAAEAAGIFR